MQVTVGRIGRPHGIRGDVVVGVRTDEPELRFAKGSRLDTDPAGVGPLTVAAHRWHSGELLVRFEGVGDRDAAGGAARHLAARRLRHARPAGRPRRVPRRRPASASPSARSTARAVGIVDDVLHSGQDVLVDQGGRTGARSWSRSSRRSCPRSTWPSGYLVIDPPEGLLNLEEAA